MLGRWIAIGLGPALLAAPSIACDRPAPTSAVTAASVPAASDAGAIAVEGLAVLMADHWVGTRPQTALVILTPPSAPVDLARSRMPWFSSALDADQPPARPVSHAMPALSAAPSAWQVAVARPILSRMDVAPVDRMSLEGSADYRRRRNVGLDARLVLRIDGRPESDTVSLGGRLGRALHALEAR